MLLLVIIGQFCTSPGGQKKVCADFRTHPIVYPHVDAAVASVSNTRSIKFHRPSGKMAGGKGCCPVTPKYFDYDLLLSFNYSCIRVSYTCCFLVRSCINNSCAFVFTAAQHTRTTTVINGTAAGGIFINNTGLV